MYIIQMSQFKRRVLVFEAEDGIRDVERSRGLGDMYKRKIEASQPIRVHEQPLLRRANTAGSKRGTAADFSPPNCFGNKTV